MRLSHATDRLKNDAEKALVAFLTAGYPDEATFLDLVRTAATACDLIEIGIPFSDPIADGPLIQESSKHAIDNGVSLKRSLEMAKEIAQEIATPLILMSYYNPILRMGTGRFVETCRASSVSGVIIPDVPLEESEEVRSALGEHDIGYVDLIAPTSSDDRIDAISGRARGFIYLVSVTGVTGVRSPMARDLEPFVARVRNRTNLPLYVGFGISDADAASSAARHGDGVIIGSALIKLIKSSASNVDAVERVGGFLGQVKSAIVARGEPS